MLPNPCIEIQTAPDARPSVPPWFAEVVIMAQHLATNGLLDAFAHQVPLVRGRFGRYEPLDYLALLVGYAVSGERTLAEFFERLAPFASAFMALFGRSTLPHRSSLSRFLAAVDRPLLRSLPSPVPSLRHSRMAGRENRLVACGIVRGSAASCLMSMLRARPLGNERSPCTPELPPARRRFDAVCAPGYKGRKRGEVVRTRTVTLQMHTRQWIGTYAGRGNGDYRGELASSLQAILAYLAHFDLTPEAAVVRLDGQYGAAAVIAQIIQAGVFLVTRGRGYQLLQHPQIQRVLAHPPTTSVTSTNTGQVVELFEGGWLPLDEGLPRARVIVARHPAPASDAPVTVGKQRDGWVYELFITTLGAERFLIEDVLDLYHGRGAFEGGSGR